MKFGMLTRTNRPGPDVRCGQAAWRGWCVPPTHRRAGVGERRGRSRAEAGSGELAGRYRMGRIGIEASENGAAQTRPLTGRYRMGRIGIGGSWCDAVRLIWGCRCQVWIGVR